MLVPNVPSQAQPLLWVHRNAADTLQTPLFLYSVPFTMLHRKIPSLLIIFLWFFPIMTQSQKKKKKLSLSIIYHILQSMEIKLKQQFMLIYFISNLLIPFRGIYPKLWKNQLAKLVLEHLLYFQQHERFRVIICGSFCHSVELEMHWRMVYFAIATNNIL